jgi:hypothetical protein
MKTLPLLAVLLLLMIATAGFAINPQPEPPVFAEPQLPVLRHQFVISPISALKLTLGSRTPTRVMSANKAETPPPPTFKSITQVPRVALVGNPYATGSGVVLNVLNSIDKATDSKVTVYNVLWNDNLLNALAAKDPQAKLAVWTSGEDINHFANAYFGHIAPGFHTYLLTLGTTANTNIIGLSVAGQTVDNSQLVANPTTNEVRFCFTYDNTGATGNYLSVTTWLDYDHPLGYTTYEYFHHLQLAQLD